MATVFEHLQGLNDVVRHGLGLLKAALTCRLELDKCTFVHEQHGRK